MYLQIWRRMLKLERVGLIFDFFHACPVTGSNLQAKTFFIFLWDDCEPTFMNVDVNGRSEAQASPVPPSAVSVGLLGAALLALAVFVLSGRPMKNAPADEGCDAVAKK